ncbi:hypothetical protein ACSBOB_26825 [Mesorhizobium sp. ASY16-5R]|uniref:hypothetical protein n=1 Tax=Mesorhizobium sp. ASY16-5R TaxID=3445772 RepID=UPI003FA0B145
MAIVPTEDFKFGSREALVCEIGFLIDDAMKDDGEHSPYNIAKDIVTAVERLGYSNNKPADAAEEIYEKDEYIRWLEDWALLSTSNGFERDDLRLGFYLWSKGGLAA